MKVQVTKDNFGVVVWPGDEEITYSLEKSSNWISKGEIADMNWVPGWMRKRFTFFQSLHQILTAKQVAKYMPELGKDMQNGQKLDCELTITKI